MAKRVKYGDSEYERTVMEWFDDIESEVSSSDGTDIESEVSNCENGIESEHDTHSTIVKMVLKVNMIHILKLNHVMT
ncbi:hypothetical protein QE152_g4793 [Popillia japonica]|uniref:Uncharacterized protein n=1 Tax=Popillia japonica TaxID=7064 RepID=A0AAW1MYZ7_POPJA